MGQVWDISAHSLFNLVKYAVSSTLFPFRSFPPGLSFLTTDTIPISVIAHAAMRLYLEK